MLKETSSNANKEDKKFLKFPADTTHTDNPARKIVSNEKPVITTTKNNCRVIAGNHDFLKLRRRMVEKTNDDSRIDEAKKYFKDKCFTTEQIRELGSIFLSSAGKYHFFDASYDHVSDRENFSSLQSELTDEYYINRFKAMLHD